MNTTGLALFSLPQGTELLLILVVGLLLFGKRLPDVARSIGKSIIEFKKGMRDVREDIEKDSSESSLPPSGANAPRQLPEESRKNQDKSAAGV